MNDQYILKDKKPVACDDLLEWGEFMQSGERTVAKSEKGEVRVSTVFLGLDHSFGSGDPLLFETMIFGGEHDQDCERYCTWEEAEAGHKSMCEKAFA